MTAVPVSPAGRRDEPRSAPIALAALILVTALLALYGAELAAGALRSRGQVPAVGIRLDTSFGSVTVEHAQTIDGLPSGDMSNEMTHGIQDLVQPGEAQVAVAVYLRNDGDRPTPIDAGQFRLLIEGRADPAPPTGGTVLPTRLQPGSGVRGTLVFVVPLDGNRTSVLFQDPGGGEVAIPIGRLDGTPPAEPQHSGDAGHSE